MEKSQLQDRRRWEEIAALDEQQNARKRSNRRRAIGGSPDRKLARGFTTCL
jgi:hypothetical protein